MHEFILVLRTWDALDFWQLAIYMWDSPINTKTKLLFLPCELINHMSVWPYSITMWLAGQNSNVAMLNYRYVHYWKGNGSLSFMNANFATVNCYMQVWLYHMYHKLWYVFCTTESTKPYLLFANYRSIKRINANGSQLETVFYSNTSNAVGVDYDFRYVWHIRQMMCVVTLQLQGGYVLHMSLVCLWWVFWTAVSL